MIKHSAYALVIEQRDQMVFLIALLVVSALVLLWSLNREGRAHQVMRWALIGGYFASLLAMWLVLRSPAN